MTKIAPYMKSLIGAVVAGLASAQQALDDGVISPAEGVGIAAAVFAGLVLVFSVPNKDPEAEHQDESVQPPAGRQILGKAFTGGTFSKAEEDARRTEDGRADVLYILAVVALVLVVLALVGLI